MELILDFSSYKDRNIGKLIFNNYIFNFIYEHSLLSVLITNTTMEDTNIRFDLITFDNKNDFLNKDVIYILSKMNTISYIKNILPIELIVDSIISNFILEQRKIEYLILNYIKILFINGFVFVYKRNTSLITKLIICQTSTQKKYYLNDDYPENTFHLDIINNCKDLFRYDNDFANAIIHSVLQEI